MKMIAKVILVPKSNSFQFDDRILLLEEPVKIGRSHKEDRAESDNGFFDCKVLSRVHATFSYVGGRFYLQDMGSSNGSFVNNIRLSKSGEESKPTEIFSGDVVRFGSDVVDKAKNVTQKAVVSKVQLIYPDGTECVLRPPESKLFRPTESYEDLQNMNQALQEAQANQQLLEDRILQVRSLISSPSSGSTSHPLRFLEEIEEELLRGSAAEDMQSVLLEKRDLTTRLGDIEKKLEDREAFCVSVQKKQTEDSIEIVKLRQLIDKQNRDLANLEAALTDSQSELEDTKARAGSRGMEDQEERLYQLRQNYEAEMKNLKRECEAKVKEIEDSFADERTKIRQQLQEVTANEIILLDKIKSLESEKGYARAEVDRVVVKDADNFEYRQELEYRIECLATEVAHYKQQVEDLEGRRAVERDPADIQMIASQAQNIAALKEEVSYIKKELIDARSRKAAAEDDLNTVKGTVETLNNSVNSLSIEGESLKKIILQLEENLAVKTREADHLAQLLAAMEAQPGQAEAAKVQIADLKQELAASQAEVKMRMEEILKLKTQLRLEKETVQQKEIEISRLNGQVQFVEEEKELLKNMTGDVDSLQAEINQLRNRLNLVVEELELTREDNTTLSRELEQQQVLYQELRKMRGMGEELDMLQQAQRDVVAARERGELALSSLREAMGDIARLEGERIRLLREVAQLKSGRGIEPGAAQLDGAVNEEGEVAAQTVPHQQGRVLTGEALMGRVGSLKLYEILIGLLFISVIISWNPYTLPL